MTLAADRPDRLSSATNARVRDALANARDHLLGLQDPAGWWKGELETNVTMEAEDLLLRQFLGILGPRDGETTQATARWIRAQQRADGTWSTFFAGPPDLSTTVEAYIALKLAGDDPAAPHMAIAAQYIRDCGGLERSRVFTRLWLALFGLWSWDDLPTMPPEMIFLPSWFPLNIYDWACWARQTVVPLTIVGTLRPCRPLGVEIDELRTGIEPDPLSPAWTVAGAFQRLDKVLAGYGRLARRGPARALRSLAMRRGAEWILARQEADGSWGGIQPPWVYSIMALHLLGYSLDHPALRKGLDGLEDFTIREAGPDGKTWRRLEACQSPVWDTALAVVALADAGLPADHPALTKAADWLLGEEITVRGDWAVKRPQLMPGGWAFEFANDGYPDTDDTAEVVLSLLRVRFPDAARQKQLAAAVRRGVAWTVGMRSKDGGWGAFDADNTRELVRKLPFCDFGAVIDPPSADVTAHIVEMLGALGASAAPTDIDTAARDGVAWLLRHQEADGSWFGRWGANHIYGTGAVVPALVAAGVSPSAPSIKRAVRWLERHQNDDGGWGEDLRSYKDRSWAGRGTSTASQTAWALLALLAGGQHDSGATRRGIAYLVNTQRSDGTWDEPQYTGTGFPGDFSINYHLYRLIFPVTALGRYVAANRVIDLTAEIPDQQTGRS